jgi:hypothetical protein
MTEGLIPGGGSWQDVHPLAELTGTDVLAEAMSALQSYFSSSRSAATIVLAFSFCSATSASRDPSRISYAMDVTRPPLQAGAGHADRATARFIWARTIAP